MKKTVKKKAAPKKAAKKSAMKGKYDAHGKGINHGKKG